MPKATFHEGTYELGPNDIVYLKYIKANLNEITLRYIGASSVPNSGYYGINGTYYDNGPNLVGIAINNGQYIRTNGPAGYNGEQNRVPARECGTFVVLNDTINTRIAICDKISAIPNSGFTYKGYHYNKSDIRMAIGGTSLYTGAAYNDMTENEFYDAIWPSENPGGMSAEGDDGYAPRTAILYLGGNYNSLNTVLLTVIGQDSECSPRDSHGCTLWQLRNLIREYPAFKLPNGDPPIMAINLDGGGSTQIRYKDNNGNAKYYYVDNGNGQQRLVRSMLCVDM